MHTLTHYRLCPKSRALRLAVAEVALDVSLVEQEPWAIGAQFLALNPAGELPVLEIDQGPVLCGLYAAAEYVSCDLATSEQQPAPSLHLFGRDAEERAEVRRLVDWFVNKMERDVTGELLFEKVYARKSSGAAQSPNSDVLRIARSNLKYHMSYISFLADQRPWLAGEEMSFADLAASAHVATLDYLDEIDWAAYPVAKVWYQRMKSRPAFRDLLADRIPGMPPPERYADLDF